MGKYRIQIEDSKIIKETFLNEDLTHEDAGVENFVVELSDLLRIKDDPTQVAYWGESYDGEFEMILEGISEVKARIIFDKLCSAASVETNLILVDLATKYVSEAKVLERTTGENYMVYVI